VVTPLVAIVAVTVVELAIGIAIGYALGRRDDDTPRRPRRPDPGGRTRPPRPPGAVVSAGDVEAAFALDVLAQICRQHGLGAPVRTNGEPTVPDARIRRRHLALVDRRRRPRRRSYRSERTSRSAASARRPPRPHPRLEARPPPGRRRRSLDVLGRGGQLEER
jgi:hypothetical protein